MNGQQIKALQLGQELNYIKLKQKKKLSYNNRTTPFLSHFLPCSTINRNYGLHSYFLFYCACVKRIRYLDRKIWSSTYMRLRSYVGQSTDICIFETPWKRAISVISGMVILMQPAGVQWPHGQCASGGTTFHTIGKAASSRTTHLFVMVLKKKATSEIITNN